MTDHDDTETCDACAGSGEGMHDGSTCRTCKGSGERLNAEAREAAEEMATEAAISRWERS